MFTFENKRCLIVTKHDKQNVILPPLMTHLGLKGDVFMIDTDIFGTFCGTKKRPFSALECARQKCLLAAESLKTSDDELFISSEGSFGPHPLFPFLNAHQEILYVYERASNFHFHISESYPAHYVKKGSFKDLESFIQEAPSWLFPSHGVILRPQNPRKDFIIQSITSFDTLKQAFEDCLKHSLDHTVLIDSDMRASSNPTRMKHIGHLAEKLAKALQISCPCCLMPGWSFHSYVDHLPCQTCYAETTLGRCEHYSCKQCGFSDLLPRADGLTFADPRFCPLCNP